MNTGRNILFKAKRKDNGKWIEGYYVKVESKHFIIRCGMICGNNDLLSMDDEYYEIDISTLSQFTGLIDMNGNKIWENDIVLYGDEFWHIGWSEYDAYFTIEQDGFIKNFGNIWSRLCEVYGNIFDNAGLLLLHPEEIAWYEVYETEE